MKQENIFVVVLGLICLVAYFYYYPKQRPVIDLPEEIGVVVKGDSLIVDRVSNDTVYVVFNNTRNR